ncbi:hypothetical protein BDV23DRAFT_184531 [Aspergillus alliaceus]|uniref:Uncharacterized protein n=1 Tax=Petromyces alliaceus TaxID=209559 RepID=A0A5N7C5A4_PETAA|nr:hypothetical protein BDV23DRAFT_184531 [Aspergillus alliaceus]
MVGGELLEVLVEKGKQILFGKAFHRCMFGRVIVEDEEAGTVVQSRGSRSTIIVVSAIAPIIIAAVVPLARPAASLRSPGHEFRAVCPLVQDVRSLRRGPHLSFLFGQPRSFRTWSWKNFVKPPHSSRLVASLMLTAHAVRLLWVPVLKNRGPDTGAAPPVTRMINFYPIGGYRSGQAYGTTFFGSKLCLGRARRGRFGPKASFSRVRPKICAVTPATHGQQDHDGVNPPHGGSSDVGSVLVTGPDTGCHAGKIPVSTTESSGTGRHVAHRSTTLQ